MTESPVYMRSGITTRLVLDTAPSAEPLTVADCRQHCRIDVEDEDALLETYIRAARDRAEVRTGRQIMPATWKLYLDAFPSEIRVPRPHLQSVTSIAYTDSAGASQTLSASLYQVDTASEPGRILPAWGQSWPATRGTLNDVVVTYKAGYGAGHADADTANGLALAAIPPNLRLGLLHYVAQWYSQREPVNVGNIVNVMPMAGDALVDQFYHGWAW